MFRAQRWSRVEVPTEREIRLIMAGEGLHAHRWSNAPGDVYTTPTHPSRKMLYVVAGSITFGLPEGGQRVTFHAGDRLDLPKSTMHDAVVGPEGVVCLEAHRP
jgi:cupin superfamily acireductone dioxygenase involved in methionine salvage